MADEKTLEELEEERFLKEIGRAKSSARANVFAKKQPLFKPQTQEPTPVAKPGLASPKGGEPEWKRRQREAEEAEAQRKAEEERRKRERLSQLPGVSEVSPLADVPTPAVAPQAQVRGEIDTSSQISPRHIQEDREELERLEEERLSRKLGNTRLPGAAGDAQPVSPPRGISNQGFNRNQSSPRQVQTSPRQFQTSPVHYQPPQHQPNYHVPSLSVPAHGEIDTSSLVKTSPRHSAEEKEAQLLAEEQRLAKKIGNTAHGPELHQQQHAHASPQHQSSGVAMCDVLWIEENFVIRQQSFPTLKGRLPLASMKRIWGVHTIIWADRNEELTASSDGYTEAVFDRPAIRVWCK